MKNKDICLSKTWVFVLKAMIALSIPFLSLMTSFYIFKLPHAFRVMCIAIFLSFVVGIFVLRKIDLSRLRKKDLFLSALMGLYAGQYFSRYGRMVLDTFFGKAFKIIKVSISLTDVFKIIRFALIPACIFYAYLFIKYIVPKIKKFLKSLTIGERRYLKVVEGVGIVVVLLLAFNTNLFYRPTYNNKIVVNDVVYTSDTGALVYHDAFTNFRMEENDIRQPLFGLCAFPFGLVARFASQFMFFLPNYSYELTLMFIQFLLLAFTLIMLARIIKLDEKDKKYFYLLFSCSFPYLLFSVVVEQYVIGLFYLTLTFYLYFTNDKINYAFIGATGTLLTSGITFPLITKFKNCKQWIKDIMWCAVIFLVVMTLSGQLVQLPYVFKTLTNLSRFTGKIPFVDKLYQFTHFVKGIFISSPGEVVFLEDIPRYFLKAFDSYSLIGIGILVIVFVSFLLNRKDKMSVIAFLWIIFSFIILVVVGWGTAENGLILYSLYFAWAYLLLIYKFIRSIIKDVKKANILIVCLVILLFLCNIKELYQIIKFGLDYYSMW